MATSFSLPTFQIALSIPFNSTLPSQALQWNNVYIGSIRIDRESLVYTTGANWSESLTTVQVRELDEWHIFEIFFNNSTYLPNLFPGQDRHQLPFHPEANV